MSNVPTWVLADDNFFYKNPILGDSSGNWFVCFDDDDDPEIVVKRGVIGIDDVLKKLPRDSRLISGVCRMSRCFPSSWKVCPAQRAFVEISAPISSELILKSDRKLASEDFRAKHMDCVYYSFGR